MVMLRSKKRRVEPKNSKKVVSAKSKKTKVDYDEISSDSDLDSIAHSPPNIPPLVESSGDEDETAQEKKMRLTKKYLEQLQTIHAQDGSDDDESKDVVGEKLKEDVLEQAGRLQKKVADVCSAPDAGLIRKLKGHRLSVTCLAVSSASDVLFTSSKDCSIIKWCLSTYRKLAQVKGGKATTGQSHTGQVLCLALSTDSKFLASSGHDKLILIWNPASMTHVHTFRGHKNAVTGLAFRLNSHQLFSSSQDRTVKVWNLESMGYVETLYGHQEAVQACDSLTRERCISCGGRDGSVRIWKIVDESQLLYHGHTGSIDCVRFINEEHMISGSDDGSICVWSIMKKRPIVVVRNAHGEAGSANCNWISSVAALPNSDLLATGSSDGYVRLWKCGEKYLKLTPLFEVAADGFVNDLRFTEDGLHLVAAIGQEHKLGRWWRIKEARNSTLIIPLKSSDKTLL